MMNSITSAPLTILHRDPRLIVIDKPSGLIVHRTRGDHSITAADIIRDDITHCQIFGVHRLDRSTSGILMFALDSEMARLLQTELQSGRVNKQYVALVRGPMLEACTLDHPIKMKETGRVVDALTHFEPLAHFGRWTMVEARPVTGRLHQIRRHLKHLNHPIVGDVRWGKGEINRMFRQEHGLHRMALHCYKLGFNHPDLGNIEIDCPLPPDLVLPLKSLGMKSLPDRLIFSSAQCSPISSV